LVGIAGSYLVAWFGIRVNTFANSRTAFASLKGVKDILAKTDRDSVMNHLKDEIRSKLNWNRHAGKK
jgi:hypothetical protein